MARLFAFVIALVVCLAGFGIALAAEEETPRATTVPRTPLAFVRPGVEIQNRLLTPKALSSAVQPAHRRPSRDSLKNGAVIGAIAGAVGAGAFTALICRLYREDGGSSCWPDTLRGAAIGAAVGTGAGIGIDAAHTRQPGVVVRVGVTF